MMFENTGLLLLGGIIAAPLLALVGSVAYDAWTRRTGSSIVLGAALGLLFVGERLFGEGSWRPMVSGLGLLVLAAAVLLRVRASTGATGTAQTVHGRALTGTLLVGLAVALYGVSLPSAMDMAGLGEETLPRAKATLATLWPILALLGFLPTVWLDRVLALHPIAVPERAAEVAWQSGLIAALSISLLFPLNYLADANNVEKDVAYFRTTRPGTATATMITTLAEPVEALLFFPSGNDVGREVKAYFDSLAQIAGDRLTVRLVDQALDPATAEKLKVRDNGDVAFVLGEKNQRFKIGLELGKARKDLKRLDSLVQTNLLKLTKAQRTAYFLAGHGEASSREKENPLEKLNIFKKFVLEAQNFKVTNLGVSEGSAVAVPDDAALVVIAAPKKPLLPEEEAALEAYWDRGGRILAMTEPGADPMTPLMAKLGVTVGTAPLANAEKYIQQTRGPADRVLLMTNKFGSHESVKTLSKNSTQFYVVLPTVSSVTKTPDTTNKVTTMLRSFPDTWEDLDGDRTLGPNEHGKVHEFGQAISAGDDKTGSRAVVFGDVNLMSDPLLESLQGNQQLALDVTRWLVGEDEVSGTTESEEDVKVQHTREEDQYWFWFTTAAMPGMILALGGLVMRFRGRRA